MPPRVHDLAELADMATRDRPDLKSLTDRIESVSAWSVLTRYPSAGDIIPPTGTEVKEALALVRDLRALVAREADAA